jgi:toxin ParE1/3/4
LTDFAVSVGPAARRDLEDYIIWLRGEADAETAARFAVAATQTFQKLSEAPNLGPAISSANPHLAGIRKWRVQDFPKILIFFRPLPGAIEIVRVLHAAQDWWVLLDFD